MDYRFTNEPERYVSFFLAENRITHPEYEYIIHLAEPRCFIKYRVRLAMFAGYDEFYDSIAEVQWLDGQAPDADIREQLLTDAWNYLCIEERILDADYGEMEDEYDDDDEDDDY